MFLKFYVVHFIFLDILHSYMRTSCLAILYRGVSL